jgi:hypothetical protein
MKISLLNLTVVLLTLFAGSRAALAQGTAFTYQGELSDGAGLANGTYDFQFTVRDAAAGGNAVGVSPLTATLPVSSGRFTVTLDPGAAVFTGAARWLEIAVRTNGASLFTTLTPTQPITATPYATFAAGVSAAGLTGTIPAANIANGTITSNLLSIGAVGANQLAAGAVTASKLGSDVGLWSVSGGNVFRSGGNVGIGTASPTAPLEINGDVKAANFVGSGVGLTALPTNTARLDANQVFTGSNAFKGRISGASVFANYTLGDPSSNGLSVKLEMTDSNHRTIASLGGDKTVGGQLFLNSGTVAGLAARLIISNFSGDTVTRLNGDGSAYFQGNVGIGKTNPATALDIEGTITATAFSGDGTGLTALPANAALLNANQTFTGVNSFDAGPRINGASALEFGAGVAGKEANAGKIGYQTFGPGALDIVGAGTNGSTRQIRFWAEGGAQFMGAVNAPSANISTFGGNVTVTGNLGSSGSITAPLATIPVLNGPVSFNGNTRLNGANTLEFGAGVAGKEPSAGKIGYEAFGPGALDIVGAGTGTTNRQVRVWAEGGAQFMGAVSAPSATIPVLNGNVMINGEMTANVVTITGGSDVAEPYHVAGAADVTPMAGMVVAINPGEIGQMRIASRAYDKTVAGILSGANGIAPGITLRQSGTIADGSLPVASIGRVWCYCDADANGQIEAGDMLTTSDTPGHAMKVADYDRANGSIIGKAMSPLKSGRGLVLVFVSLK